VYYVYILICSDGSYYIGHAADLEARVQAHNSGRGAAYTYKHRPVRLVYAELHPTRPSAIRRERQLKGWTRRKKQGLIRGDIPRLRARRDANA